VSLLVAYSSKHGATRTIAERIGETLRGRGLEAEVRPVKAASDLDAYEAFVVGGAVYFGSWAKEVTSFLGRHQAVLAEHPVWLFSSGPLGDQPTDAQGRDPRETSQPNQLENLATSVHARDCRVFFGALDHTQFDVCERLLWALPASRKLLIEGDFRDWAAIDTWANSIADQLEPVGPKVGGKHMQP
jgi:menaquinone-dependent protoporphyrinogen oxidase